MTTTTKHPTPGERVDGFGRDMSNAIHQVAAAMEQVPDLYELLADAELAEIERATRNLDRMKSAVARVWVMLDEHTQHLAAVCQARRDEYTRDT